MKATEFQIINGGKRHPLEFNNRVCIEYVSGFGNGDQSYWCEFTSTYRVYRQSGNSIAECGSITEIEGTDRKSFSGEIDGKKVSCDFLSARDVFTRIERIKIN